MPHLKEVYEKYKDKGFEVIGISLDTDKKSWVRWLDRINVSWQQLCNYEGSQSKFAKAYLLREIPYGVLLNREGTIIETNLESNLALEKKLQELFDKDRSKFSHIQFSPLHPARLLVQLQKSGKRYRNGFANRSAERIAAGYGTAGDREIEQPANTAPIAGFAIENRNTGLGIKLCASSAY